MALIHKKEDRLEKYYKSGRASSDSGLSSDDDVRVSFSDEESLHLYENVNFSSMTLNEKVSSHFPAPPLNFRDSSEKVTR